MLNIFRRLVDGTVWVRSVRWQQKKEVEEDEEEGEEKEKRM